MQLLERSAQAVELIHQMKDDVDTLVVDSEIGFQVPDEMCPHNVHVGEVHSGESLLWNEPSLLKPEFQRLRLEARKSQELLLVHDHDVLSSRGLNASPVGVGTRIRPPSTASEREIGNSREMSSPSRVKRRSDRTSTSIRASP